MSIKTYSELITFPTFKERYKYLRIGGVVGQETFGFDRYLNQLFYKSPEWLSVRDQVIFRDSGCDLGIPGREIYSKILVHHMNPITKEDILKRSDLLLDPEYLICTVKRTHDAIHYGDDSIAYTDGTEKITQLNRSLENNLLKQVEYLTNMVYSQLGITQSVLDGTADEKTMLNYMNRTVEPIISAIVDELKRKFLTKTARSQLQSIVYFRDPFRLVPVNDIAEIADKLTRNEIMTSNEIRQIVGMQPSKDPKADKLVNSNISQAKQDMSQTSSATEAYEEGGYSQNG